MTETSNGTPPSDGWLIDCDITKKEEQAFFLACKEAAIQETDWGLFPFFAQYIKKWPYESDPANAESYQNLKRSQYKEAYKRVLAEFQKTSPSS